MTPIKGGHDLKPLCTWGSRSQNREVATLSVKEMENKKNSDKNENRIPLTLSNAFDSYSLCPTPSTHTHFVQRSNVNEARRQQGDFVASFIFSKNQICPIFFCKSIVSIHFSKTL
ncbi:uncharacterized protein G2W53_018214 [Senna tora]|uniref:Uncharacterized protein n=1 Tax=Senna tora TaxID=362788 RepID=A0A834TVF6_9FABA|nr:uncharacterized protein G2W53_018214 [Senna tora]